VLKEISRLLNKKESELNKWYKEKLSLGNKCFYTSVDIRYCGNKLVPIDTNLFPAGFNNLNEDNIEQASKLTKEYITNISPNCKNILIIGEDHTRNLHYLDNLKTIENIITQAGYTCKIGSLNSTEEMNLNGISYKDINIIPLIKEDNLLKTTDGFQPDLIILNNDLMLGEHEKLKNIKQNIIPSPYNGWFKRRKSKHFEIYNKLMDELEEKFSLPSHIFTAEFSICSDLDFKSRQGIEKLAVEAEILLKKIKEKYIKHNINNEPYIVIKSNYGTYGMGVMSIKSADEVLKLNKKFRQQMHITKHNIVNNEVILQEGIKTIDIVNNSSAEPMLYLMNHQLVSFLFRSHDAKDEYSNLNSVGMKISNHKLDYNEYHQCCEFISRIATLAAALE
jgi:glutamate--cysteine ligase